MVGLKDALARSQARATSRDGESILRRADELAAFVVNGAATSADALFTSPSSR
jgi:hypothetical protein